MFFVGPPDLEVELVLELLTTSWREKYMYSDPESQLYNETTGNIQQSVSEKVRVAHKCLKEIKLWCFDIRGIKYNIIVKRQKWSRNQLSQSTRLHE